MFRRLTVVTVGLQILRPSIQNLDVQIIQEDGSNWCTVFVDGTPAHMPEDRVQGHITAKVRR